MTSAYPPKLDQLTERVRAMATELGDWPSLRQIKQRCNVGHPKAVEALAALRASGFTPAGADDETAPVPATPRRLQVVPTPDTAPLVEDQDDTTPVTIVADVDTAPAPAWIVDEVTAAAEPPATADTTRVPADVTSPIGNAAEPSRTSGLWRNVPLYLIALGAFVAIWGGWVGLGQLTGFGPVNLLPGIGRGWTLNTAITLPLGMEAYAAYAMRVWLDRGKSALARRFAMWSTFAALLLGMSGQVAYHLMTAAGMTSAPWQITTFVSCLPVLVLGGAAALVHLSHNTSEVQR
ncbi:ABC transporter permease [Lentzea sp. NPDC004782]|uniref:ABC transporter permease n=1 Tax=Lentzea sp. NPDC004782 TaxID=3154458 RepID=UPI0033BD48BB